MGMGESAGPRCAGQKTLMDANPTVATLERIAEAMGKKLIVGLQDYRFS